MNSLVVAAHDFGSLRIEIVRQHHHVLLPWCRWRRISGVPAQILTFDHHTDVLAAYGARQAAPFDYSSDQAVMAAIAALHHDEHLDWAVRAGIARSCTILAQENFTVPAHAALRVVCSDAWPDSQEIFAGTARARAAAANWLEADFLAAQLAEAPLAAEHPLILDLDLDCFLSARSLLPEDPSRWNDLVRRAALITVSQEREWCDILRFPGEKFDAEAAVLKLIERALI